MFKINRKAFLLRIILLTITIVSLLFGTLNIFLSLEETNKFDVSYVIKYKSLFWNFIQLNYLIIIFILFVSFSQLKIKKTNFFCYLHFITLINIFVGVFCFLNILSNNYFNIVSAPEPFGPVLFFVSYVLGFMILPFLFLYYVWNYINIPDWKKIWIVFIFPFFYFLIDFLISYWVGVEICSSPIYHIYHLHSKNAFNLFFIFIKIMMIFLLFSLALITIKKIKVNILFKILFLLFIIFLLFISFGDKYFWQHGMHALSKHQQSGALFLPETESVCSLLTDGLNSKNKLVKDKEKIIELGSGTGNITKFLTDKYGEENIVAFELDHDLCILLKERFPRLEVIEGDVSNTLEVFLTNNKYKVKDIVSSLPINLLTEDQITKIDKQIYNVMSKDKDVKFKEYRYVLPYQVFSFLSLSKGDQSHQSFDVQDIKETDRKYAFANWFIPTKVLTYQLKSSDNKNRLSSLKSSHLQPISNLKDSDSDSDDIINKSFSDQSFSDIDKHSLTNLLHLNNSNNSLNSYLSEFGNLSDYFNSNSSLSLDLVDDNITNSLSFLNIDNKLLNYSNVLKNKQKKLSNYSFFSKKEKTNYIKKMLNLLIKLFNQKKKSI